VGQARQLGGREVFVENASTEESRTSPSGYPSAPINREYEARLYDYYGRPVYWNSDDRQVKTRHCTSTQEPPAIARVPARLMTLVRRRELCTGTNWQFFGMHFFWWMFWVLLIVSFFSLALPVPESRMRLVPRRIRWLSSAGRYAAGDDHGLAE